MLQVFSALTFYHFISSLFCLFLECDFLLLEADPGVSEADLFPRRKLLSVRRVRKLSNMRKPHVPHSSMAAIFRVIKFIHHVY